MLGVQSHANHSGIKPRITSGIREEKVQVTQLSIPLRDQGERSEMWAKQVPKQPVFMHL